MEKDFRTTEIADHRLPDLCYVNTLTNGIGIVKKGESGYYVTDLAQSNGLSLADNDAIDELVDQFNKNLGVTKEQATAMKIGSMFGWDVPGAQLKEEYLEESKKYDLVTTGDVDLDWNVIYALELEKDPYGYSHGEISIEDPEFRDEVIANMKGDKVKIGAYRLEDGKYTIDVLPFNTPVTENINEDWEDDYIGRMANLDLRGWSIEEFAGSGDIDLADFEDHLGDTFEITGLGCEVDDEFDDNFWDIRSVDEPEFTLDAVSGYNLDLIESLVEENRGKANVGYFCIGTEGNDENYAFVDADPWDAEDKFGMSAQRGFKTAEDAIKYAENHPEVLFVQCSEYENGADGDLINVNIDDFPNDSNVVWKKNEDDCIDEARYDKNSMSMAESLSENLTDYNPEEWSQEDIDLHKSIDWKARNFEEYPVENDIIDGTAKLYRIVGREMHTEEKPVKLQKYLSANPIFPPVYKPVEEPFNALGPMYNGDRHGIYHILNRYEDQETYDMLSESKSIEETKAKDEICYKVNLKSHWCNSPFFFNIYDYVFENDMWLEYEEKRLRNGDLKMTKFDLFGTKEQFDELFKQFDGLKKDCRRCNV